MLASETQKPILIVDPDHAAVESLHGGANPDKSRLQQAIDRLERAEAGKARVMIKIEKLEASLLES